MPWIQKKKSNKDPDINRVLRQKIYNTTRWRNLRAAYLSVNPLCSECLAEGKTTAAEEVHHVVSFMNAAPDLSKMRELAYDWNNLQGLCDYHHNLKHHNNKINNWNRMNKVTLQSNTVQEVLNYLIEQKFKDVYKLIGLIQADLAKQEQEKREEEKSEEF